MTVIARDGVAADHLVYAWPFPLGPECEVSCGDDEEVVMCPAWLVGDRLGPGHHRYRTPDPTRPVSAFFVLTSPVEASFDMTTMFLVPSTRQPVRLRATGSLQVRCGDPGLLIAQFVGLPFDHVNDGILRSVSRSVERMLARLLTRRVVMASTPLAVTDPQMQPSIIEELVAYNPTAGAVFGIELTRMGHLTIAFDDGSSPFVALPGSTTKPAAPTADDQRPRSGEIVRPRDRDVGKTQPSPTIPSLEPPPIPTGGRMPSKEAPILQTLRGTKPAEPPPPSQIVPRYTSVPPGAISNQVPSASAAATERAVNERSGPKPDAATERAINERSGPKVVQASGEIVSKVKTPLDEAPTDRDRNQRNGSAEDKSKNSDRTQPMDRAALGLSPNAGAERPSERNGPAPRIAQNIEIPKTDDTTQPHKTPVPGTLKMPPLPRPSSPAIPAFNKPVMAAPNYDAEPAEEIDEEPSRGSIMGIGVGQIGQPVKSGGVAGEIPSKVAPGGRVLVPGPNGLMQSATVRQLLQGYYELEVGSSGETIWVPISGVVPE